ncbi:MAG: peptide-methionine (S)-S-oxide reductase MsrA [Bacteroidota bacterium]
MNQNLEIATFGAGCFWCVEAVFQDLKGVHSVISGYCNGHVENPTYREVCYGQTGHAEVCQIHFDPSAISFEQLLEVFWTTHDPTTLNRQGNDVGTQYRSGIYYNNEDQKSIAEKSLNEVGQQLWNGQVVTEIVAAEKFYTAEDYHQNYYNLNPNQGYCRAIINPKVSKFKKTFSHLLKDQIKANETK